MSVAQAESRTTPITATVIAAVLALPIALIASAAAELLVTIAMIPIAGVISHDPYVMLLSPSYAFSAAALSAQWLLIAALVWALIWPLLAARGSILASAGGGVVALVALFFSITAADHWSASLLQHATIALPMPLSTILALFAGALAGFVAMRWDRRTASQSNVTSTRAASLRSLGSVAAFALALACILEGVVALLIAVGLT